MKQLELEIGVEQPIFQMVINNPNKVLTLPKEFYDKFLKYMIQEEMYEYIPKLEGLKDKIIDKTFEQLIEESYNSPQNGNIFL
jgi:hypothetical protein